MKQRDRWKRCSQAWEVKTALAILLVNLIWAMFLGREPSDIRRSKIPFFSFFFKLIYKQKNTITHRFSWKREVPCFFLQGNPLKVFLSLWKRWGVINSSCKIFNTYWWSDLLKSHILYSFHWNLQIEGFDDMHLFVKESQPKMQKVPSHHLSAHLESHEAVRK